jgi:uncharacterized protein (TIRG00374 family)
MRISRTVFRKIIIYLIAVVCLAWVLRGVHFDELFHHMRGINLWWIIPAMMIDVFTTVVHGIRWRLLLQSIGSVTLLRTVQAIYAALFTNEIMPVKAGEFVRGYLLSRWLRTSFASILPSMIAERAFDGSILILGFGLSTLFISLPSVIVKTAWILAAILLLAIVSMVVLASISKGPSTTDPKKSAKKSKTAQHISTFSSQFISGLHLIRTFSQFLKVLTATIFYFSSQVLAYWLVMKAYGLHFPFWVPAVVLIIVRLGTALPNAPGNLGPFQFFCVVALTLFGVEKTTATGFAIVIWLVFSLPIFILGSVAFLRSGLSLSEIRAKRQQSANGRKQ